MNYKPPLTTAVKFSPKEPTTAEPLKKSSAFHGTRRFMTVFT
jgi:hypothetical protein